MYSYLVCQLFLVVVTVKAIVSHPMGDGMAFTRLNKTYEEKLRLELIKQNILRGLHIRNREVEKEKETSHDKSYFDRKLKTSAIHKALANSRPGSVTAIILADHDSDPHHAENLIFQFRFGHKIFTDVTLNKATLSFYKTSQQKATLEKQNIALAEIIFDRIHVFTSTKKDAGLEGWVQIDMTEHVSYWVADFDNGQLETRILKLSCTNCKEKFGMKTNSDFSPFITIDLTPNS